MISTGRAKVLNNKIAYYFEPIDAFKQNDDLEDLIDLHNKSFRQHGWDVVHLDERTSRRHPLYDVFNDPDSVFAQSKNGWEYTQACYMRWLAYAVVGYPFADFDVINYGFRPQDAAKLRRLSIAGEPVFISFAGAVGLVYGSEYDAVFDAFLEYRSNQAVGKRSATLIDVNDMNILRERRPQWFALASDARIAQDYTRSGWEKAKLVHFPYHYTKRPRAAVVKSVRPIRSPIISKLRHVFARSSSFLRNPLIDLALERTKPVNNAEVQRLRSELAVSNRDRADHLEVIEHLHAEVQRLRSELAVSNKDRADRLKVIERLDTEVQRLRSELAVSNKDRADRLKVIECLDAEVQRLRSELAVSNKDRADRLKVIECLDAEVQRLRSELAVSGS